MHKHTTTVDRRKLGTNLLLAGCCGLLALNLVNGGSGVASTANAQDKSGSGGLISAAEQRKQIITAITTLQGQFTRLEQRLASGIDVRVTDMPADNND